MKMHTIDGVVMDYRRHPLADAVVLIESGTGRAPDIAAITDPNGEFSFFDVEAGVYRIKAIYGNLEAYATVRVNTAPAYVEITIR